MTASPITSTAPVLEQPDGAVMQEPPTDAPAAEPPKSRRRRKIIVLLLLVFLLALVLGLAIWYLLFRQPIPLPTLPGDIAMPTYSTAIYGTERPMGVAVTADGTRIFVGETEGDRIARMYDAGGTEVGLLQPPLSTGAEHVPVYLAMDPVNGEVYVTDRPTGKVFIYDANGVYLREFTPAGHDLTGWQPLGIAFDAAGSLYVTDVSTQPQTIKVFDRSGSVARTLGAEAGLNFPNAVAADANGFVYVTDANNGRLLVIDQEDKVVAQVGRGSGEGSLGLPRGMVVSGEKVYVADATGHSVYVYRTYSPGDRGLTFLGSFGTQGVANGTFQYPNGIAVDGRGRVYVTDAGNDRVQIWSY